MVEKCGGGFEADVGGGRVRTSGGCRSLVWLGVLGLDVKWRRFPA